MFLLIAFIGGMISLLSPCTLPVIPLLMASFRGQTQRIVALLLGMVLMFTLIASLATVASGWLVNATSVARVLALTALGLAALALIFPSFAQRLATPVVRLGNVLNDRSLKSGGTVSALLAGLAVGLLWSPCAGPILGAIIGLAIAGHSAATTGVLLAAYGSGCALMLAIIWFGGRQLIAKLSLSAVHMARLRQAGGVVMLASVVLSATGFSAILQGANGVADRLEQQLLAWAPDATSPVKLQPIADTTPTSAMPSLKGGTHWINGDPVTPASLRGKVVLIDFWTFDCINCQHTLPHVREWANKYQSQGLVVIGVHTPEYPWEKALASVKSAVEKWQLPYRVVTDDNYQIWNAFGNRYWPAHYLFDARGQLRYTAFGEGDYARQEQIIRQLLKEAHA